MIENSYPALTLHFAVIRGVRVRKTRCELIKELEEEIRRIIKIEELVSNPIIRAYRDFFWSLGVDPTKIRPSSEALVRRILRGKSLPNINNVVDAMNVISAKTLISMSTFDLDKLSPPLKLVPAEGGEKFIDISGKEFTFTKNFPKLVDSKGKIVAAVPFRDGRDTRITESTKNVFLLAYAPSTVEEYIIKKATKEAAEVIIKCAGGKLEK